ncbi:MAG: hypothetical protein ACXADW_14130 [Candidatus Hodarchaeales archaeon]
MFNLMFENPWDIIGNSIISFFIGVGLVILYGYLNYFRMCVRDYFKERKGEGK